MRSGRTPSDPQRAISNRIRRALAESRRASRYRGSRPLAMDPQRPERNRLQLSTMEERADLVGFRLTSRLQVLGRASTVVREALRRALFQVLNRQSEFNRAAVELIRTHETQLEALGATVRAQLEIQASTDERVDTLERTSARLRPGLAALERGAPRAGLTGLERLAFAERLRGTNAEIREHQRRYIPRFSGRSEIIDAGCGRGEFLELLQEAGLAAVGVDSDEAMVSRCRELGLDVVNDDVLHFLRGCPNESQGGIFAAHLIEQLERAQIVELVRLAFARLRPGGLLVLETANPFCLLTYARFYSDFANVAPVPPQALQWLAESCGFDSAEIEYASPVPAEHKLTPLPASAAPGADVEAFNRGLAAANDVLFGFQEYALIASKPG